MHQVDYDDISQVYDDVREADVQLINHFLQEIHIATPARVLDIGCGTGNHTDLFQRITQAQMYGVDPSEGMLDKARRKNESVVFCLGDGERIPFEDDYFDFAYMTDVIHHVPDLDRMFAEIRRVLKPGAKVCIVTQSHEQIERRPIVQFFPGTVAVDRQRYPDIDEIIQAAQGRDLQFVKRDVLFTNQEIEIDSDYLELIRKKGYSMLHLISDQEYEQGVRALEIALRDGNVRSKLSGETLVWLAKE